jgi:tetratricopeptide (TPR) repeat protein
MFLRRHRTSVAAACVVLLAIVGGAALATYEAQIATQQRAIAQRRFADVRRLANSFLFEFHDAIVDLPGSLHARQLVVKRAAEYLDGLARESQGDVALQRELATAYQRLGDVLGGGGASSLGDIKGAEARYLTALSLREALVSRADRQPGDVESLAQLRVQLARFFGLAGNLPRAEENARQAVALLQASPAGSSDAASREGQLATAYQQLGYVQSEREENTAAVESLEQALALSSHQAELHPDDPVSASRLVRVEMDRAQLFMRSGDASRSVGMLGDAQHRLEQLLGKDPINNRYRMGLVQVFNEEGDSLQALGNSSGAINACTKSVATAEALVAAAPEDIGNQFALILADHFLGSNLIRAGRRTEGSRRLREGIERAEAIVRKTPENLVAVNQVASMKLELGEGLLGGDARSIEGCRQIGEGLELWKTLAARAELPGESAKFREKYEELRARCAHHDG